MLNEGEVLIHDIVVERAGKRREEMGEAEERGSEERRGYF